MYDPFFGGGGFEFMFGFVFLLILVVFIVTLVRGVGEWNKNNQSPRLTVSAVVVTKRTSVTHHTHGTAGNAGMHSTSSTHYFVTFEVESGDRIELHVNGSEYGQLAERDSGKLSFQGTRYLSFERL